MAYHWGKAFFGESMFHHQADASKVALYYLVEQLKKWDFHFIDAQQSTAHLKRLGAEEIPRREFLIQTEKSPGISDANRKVGIRDGVRERKNEGGRERRGETVIGFVFVLLSWFLILGS